MTPKILHVTFTPMNGCLVQFEGWQGLADIESKAAFLRCGCVHITALDMRDREQAEELMISPIEDGQAYGCLSAVLAELAARHALWLDEEPVPTQNLQVAALPLPMALMELQVHLAKLPE